MDISNRALAVLLVIAIVVSVGGAMMNIAKLNELSAVFPFGAITGYGVTGAVNVSLQQTANLNVTQTFVDFGVGSVTTGRPGALLVSDKNWTNWTNYGGAPNPDHLAIENIGNVNLSVSIVSDKNALTYIGGGSSPTFGFNASNKDAYACAGGTLATTWTEIGVGATNTKNVCSYLGYITGANELYVGIRLYIPYDAPVGNKTAMWTFNVTAA